MNKGMSRKQPAPPQPAANPAKQRATSAEEEFGRDDVFLDETLFETEARHSPMSYTSASRSIAIGESHREFLPNWSGSLSLSGFLGLQRKGVSVKMVAAGAEHTAAVTEDGSLYGWGWGRYGNLGLGDRNDCMLLERVSMVNFGQVGVGDNIDPCSPVQVKFLHEQKVVQISCGWRHTFAVTERQNVFSNSGKAIDKMERIVLIRPRNHVSER
ncbi:X-linked retinitis pigmentosa GTPase regulator homolog [Pyrus x bretschneideri]|uniref:X-linked retinitis pigmentosa GTPase regulator homolog n=1 Tax=Pyrus x bretschneideri TaxID=225117 RepID=UPI00202E4C7E|nr:X-linked retinitis pigmentosa GTPase regulator homolog [Pyrus x bretschneideri]